MRRQLILLRHAKSSWADAGIDDHERPLNARGRQSAAAVGRWLNTRGYLPELVLSSDSARTRETWVLVGQQLQTQPRVQFLQELYLANPHTLLAALQNAPGDPSCVLMLAHNPGIAEAALQLAATLPEHAEFSRYPTGATAIFDVNLDAWLSLAWRTADLQDFVVPREL